FIGFEPLGADDMRLLQGIVALASAAPATVDLFKPKGDTGKQLALLLEPKQDAVTEEASAVRTSLQRLMNEIGYKTDGGEKREDVMESFRRLANVTVHVRGDSKEWAIHLLSYYHDEVSGQLSIAVNHRITKAIMGDGAYTHIDMREVRALHSDPGRILHQRLCATVDPGKQLTIGIDKLIGYVWPESVTGSTLRTRRQTIRGAIAELTATGGWLFQPTAAGYLISRRKIGYPELLEGSTAASLLSSAWPV
ncbi:MAG: replication protein C, IncQ-type, partial [Elusimicrobiota bacterium]